jgi:cytochrome c peroxidase
MRRTVRRGATYGACLGAAIVITAAATAARAAIRDGWSQDELATLQSLTLRALGDPPPDPSNRYASTASAAALGRRIFFDTRFSINGKVACATCHVPTRQFQDGRPLGVGVGTTGRRTMTVIASAYSPWLFWDGRADSPWAQALGPLESAVEHGGTRTLYARVIARAYATEYEDLFGALPDTTNLPVSAGPSGTTDERAAWHRLPETTQDSITRLFVNIGKAVAAFERSIRYGPSRFDRYVAGLTDSAAGKRERFSVAERAGARLFIGRAQCARCHSGSLLTDNQFHNVGVGASEPPDLGRFGGIRLADSREFNCSSRYSDASSVDCAELRYAKRGSADLVGAFRTPSLRNVALRPPYGHRGEFGTLGAVLQHYNRAPAAPVGHSELEPLHLSNAELAQLDAFLRTLNGPVRMVQTSVRR